MNFRKYAYKGQLVDAFFVDGSTESIESIIKCTPQLSAWVDVATNTLNLSGVHFDEPVKLIYFNVGFVVKKDGQFFLCYLHDFEFNAVDVTNQLNENGKSAEMEQKVEAMINDNNDDNFLVSIGFIAGFVMAFIIYMIIQVVK